MEIILKDDIKGLGFKNDTVNVKPGYGRNYLIPNGMAIIASNSNKKMINENVRQASHKAEKLKTDAENVAEKLTKTSLTILTKAGESGKIFGAITAIQIAEALKEKGFDIDRKKIEFGSNIKNVGEHTVKVILHKEVQPEITIQVVAD